MIASPFPKDTLEDNMCVGVCVCRDLCTFLYAYVRVVMHA